MPAIDDQIDLGPEVPDFSPAAEPPYVPPSPGPVGSQLLRPPPQVNIGPDMTQRNAEPSLGAVIAAPRVQGATYNLNVPAEDFNSQSYQARQEKELMAIRSRAANAEQADKDVASARRMLGMLKADRERQAMEKAGVPPAEAMQKSLFQNMSYLVQPTDKNFESSMKAVRPPPPAPTVQNFRIPGSTNDVPAFVTKDANGVTHIQAIPHGSLPQESEEVLPKVINLDDGEGGKIKLIANPKTGHFERFDKGKLTEVLTPIQTASVIKDRADIVRAQLKEPSIGDDERQLLNQELTYLKGKFEKLGQSQGRKTFSPSTAMSVPPLTARPLTRESAAQFLNQSGGDKEKARKMARDAGYSF